MDNRLLISAGDDRTLRLSQLNYRQHDLNHFAVLRSSDNASFEAISCTRINTSYYLVGINGRARELKMWKIDLKYDGELISFCYFLFKNKLKSDAKSTR